MEYVVIKDREDEPKEMSRLIMGTDHLVQADWTGKGEIEKTKREAIAVLDEALRLGINVFDTAPIYVGGVESIIGLWVASREQQIQSNDFYTTEKLNPDRKIYVLSKGGFPFDLFDSKKMTPGTHSEALKVALQTNKILSADAKPQADGSTLLHGVSAGTYASQLFGSKDQITGRVKEELDKTLRKFIHDEITIYLMHRDDADYIKFDEVSREQVPVQTIMNALSADELSSKYRMIGWSNWQTARVDRSIELAEQDSDLVKPAFNSPYFSLFEMSSRSIHAGGVQVTHEEMMDPDFQKGIMLMPYSPLGGFSILDKDAPSWEKARQHAKIKYLEGDPYWQNVYPAIFTDENQARYDRVASFTAKYKSENGTKYTLDQMINAYAIAHERTDFLVIGPTTIDQLELTVKSLELAEDLKPTDLHYLYYGD